MNLQFPAETLWVSLLPPAQLHLGGWNTQRVIVKQDETVSGKENGEQKEKWFHMQAGFLGSWFHHKLT